MPLHFHFRVHLNELPFRVKNEGRADGPRRHLAVEFLLAPRAKSLQHDRIGVGQQRISQSQLFQKLPMRLDGILADSCNAKSRGAEFLGEFSELACFLSSARGIILGVDEEHQAFGTGQIGKLRCLSVLIRQISFRV